MRRWIVLAAFAVACTHKTPDQQLVQSVEPAISWVATLRFAGEKWLADSVPASFVRASVGAAEKDLEKAASTIDQSQARKDLRDVLRDQLAESHDAAEQLKSAIDSSDRRSAAASVRRFAAASAVLQRLQKQEERQ